RKEGGKGLKNMSDPERWRQDRSCALLVSRRKCWKALRRRTDMDELSREQLERMVDVLGTMFLNAIGDATFAEGLLRNEGFETEELRDIGFDVGEVG
ncbi:MAG: hypothetical protein LUC95_12720, partial [Lachnospiraceae bacterium]|nr:hypothetical protein [Lachnospiraceae bacterium]